MRKLGSKQAWAAFLLGTLGCGLFASVVLADVHATCNPAQNTVRIRWRFPCSDPPREQGARDTTTRGNPPETPPADVCLFVFEEQDNPPTFDNRVAASGCCTDGESGVAVLAHGCAEAGPDGTESTDSPYASVGLWSDPSSPSADSPLRIATQRIVVPGPSPDLVSVTFLEGGMRTRSQAAGDLLQATVKLIVYPDWTAADLDSDLLTGAGSAFYGAVTLVGATGALVPVEGFSAGDFVVISNGLGQFTATPVAGLTKAVLVPDANAAVVTLAGDPQSTPATAVGVGADGQGMLELASPRPNPFSNQVVIGFTLPREGPASLQVFDLLGRRVRGWQWETLAPGKHAVRWDGRTDAGARPPAGTLLVRLTAMGTTIARKMTLLP